LYSFIRGWKTVVAVDGINIRTTKLVFLYTLNSYFNVKNGSGGRGGGGGGEIEDSINSKVRIL
jgi:hypothetical protein